MVPFQVWCAVEKRLLTESERFRREDMQKYAFGLIAVAGLATAASASSVTATFTSFGTASFTNKDSIAAQATAGNAADTWTATGGGTVNAIRVTGLLNSLIAGTYANEAQVRMTAGAGNAFAAFNVTASGGGTFGPAPLAIGPTQFAVTPFTLAAGNVNFEWFESYDDGPGADANWSNVSYEFGNGGTTITNGNFALGALNNTGTPATHAGSHVSGGLDFFTFSIADAVAAGGYLNIRMAFATTGSMTDTEIALYDSAGILVGTNDDIGSGPWYSQLTYGASDPIAAPGTPGFDGLTLPSGSYTLVTGGYNTVFAPTLAGAHTPGTNAGNYNLSLTYVPAPGALALLGLGGLVATRRRR